jgi:CheY-like chemotaxis protein
MIRRMRADPALAAIPTILMTALPEAIPTGAAAVHDAVLVKPFSMAELLHTLHRLLPPA